jgi:hypothetical protein
VQAAVYVILSGGRKEPAEGASWESLNPEIVSVNAAGLVTGTGPGTGRIRASLDGMDAFHDIEVSRRTDFGSIMISEVFYDATGADDGKEFIELYNDNDYTCDISGMSVVDGAAGSKAFMFPDGSVINAKSHIVLAQSKAGFNSLFGSDADFGDFSFALNNSGETVLLKKADGSIVDMVYIKGGAEELKAGDDWGSSSLPSAPSGNSIGRAGTVNTHYYSDWTSGPPSPGKG